LDTYIATKTPNSTVYDRTISYQPSAAGYNVVYRGNADGGGGGSTIYVNVVTGQTGTYGAASTLNYWYSTSPTNYGAGYQPSALLNTPYYQMQTLAGGATNVVINGSGLSGSLTLTAPNPTAQTFTGLNVTANAATYTLTLTPSLTLTGSASAFAAGNSTAFVNNAAPLNLAISKTYDGNTTFTNANPYTLTGMLNSDTQPTISAGSATTSSANVNAYSSFATNTLTLSNTNYKLAGGTIAATINQLSSVTYTGIAGGQWSVGANWTVTATLNTASPVTGAAPTLGNVGEAIVPVGTTVAYSDTMAGLAPTTTITATGTINFTNTSALSLSAIISGAGTISTSGTGGTITLGAANTGYTGATSVGIGSTLQLGNASAIGSTSAVTVIGTLDLNSYSPTLGSLAGSGTVTSSVAGAVTLATGGAGTSTTYSGLLQDGAGTLSVNKAGAGTLTLSGANTYTGGTTISAGTVMFGSGYVTTSSAVTSSPIGSGNLTIAAGATLDLNGNDFGSSAQSSNIPVITMSGTASTQAFLVNSSTTTYVTQYAPIVLSNISGAAGTAVNVFGQATNSNSASLTVAGVLSDGTGANVAGLQIGQTGYTGTVILSGANTYAGGTTVSTGTLQVVSGGVSGSNLSSGDVTLAGGTLVNNATSTITNNIFLNVGSNKVAAASEQVASFSGVISLAGTGALLVGDTTNNGTVIFTGANTYTGGTTISASTLVVASGDNLSSGNVTLLGGKLLVTATGNISNSIVLATGSNTLAAANGKTITFSGDISQAGTGPLAVGDAASTGTVVFAGSNSYTGGTTVRAGMLKINNALALGVSSGTVTVNSGAALDLNGYGTSTSITNPLTLNGTGISGGGALVNSSSAAAAYAGLLTLGSDASILGTNGSIALSYIGQITGAGFNLTIGGVQGGSIASNIYTGAGRLRKQDAGMWVLLGSNGYTDGTTITGGTLQVSSGGTSGTSLSSGRVTLGGGALVDTANSTISNNIMLTAGVNELAAASNTIANFSGVISGSGTGTLLVGDSTNNGRVIFSGVNSYSGGTRVDAGSLAAGSSTAFGSDMILVASGATLDLNGQTMTTTGVLTLNGSGVNGAGALTNASSTAATYSGNITLASASAIGSDTGALILSGVVSDTNDYGLAFVGSKDITLANASNALSTIASGSGMGALSVVNAGALKIGSVTIDATTYSGLDSTDRISVETLTGDLTISQNVNTTSVSASPAAPALLLAAGASEDVDNASGNIVLVGAPNLSVGANGIADFYSGSLEESLGLSSYSATKASNSTVFGYTRSYQPTSLGYNIVYRSQRSTPPEPTNSGGDSTSSSLPNETTSTGTLTPTDPLIPSDVVIAKQSVANPADEECTLINTLESLPSPGRASSLRAKSNLSCRVIMGTDAL
jgi:autotransporter-associated beta strand protein